jgi:hypothetical protein
MDKQKQQEKKAVATAAAPSIGKIDWRNVLPIQKIKMILQENEKISVLPKVSIELISAASALFLNQILQSTNVPDDRQIDLNDIIRVVDANEQFAFLSSTVHAVQEEQAASSLHLLPKKQTSTYKSEKRKRTSKENVEIESASVKEAVDIANNLKATRHHEIDVDEEDYD